MTPPLLSIITPVYNRIDTLGRCVDSFLRQGNVKCEMVIIDDGSQDGSSEAAAAFVENNPGRLLLLEMERNSGANAARNRGIVAASGQFIMFLDSDDFLLEHALEILFEVLRERDYRHYLFPVAYRASTLAADYEVEFKDWITGRVRGDFTHVVRRECFDNRLFFEGFRAHEELNWLRIFKFSAPQYVASNPLVAVERNRKDSLTSELSLMSHLAIKQQYEANALKISLYGGDYQQYAPIELRRIRLENALISLALGDYCGTKHYSQYLSPVWRVFLTAFRKGRFGFVVRATIRCKVSVSRWIMRLRARFGS